MGYLFQPGQLSNSFTSLSNFFTLSEKYCFSNELTNSRLSVLAHSLPFLIQKII